MVEKNILSMPEMQGAPGPLLLGTWETTEAGITWFFRNES